jgi:hypothetical protein
MARGWESKAVESQMEASLERNRHAPDLRPSNARTVRSTKAESLRLQRTRIVRDLEKALHANHRATLEHALAHLDQEIATLESAT